jgi:HK97 gp10 family phage protein
MMANSIKLNLKGLDELLERIKKAGGSIEQAAEKALVESAEPFFDDLKAGIAEHRLTGETERSLRKNKVEWEGGKASVKIGFDINNGGLPALFVEYGTPTQKAQPFIRPAIVKNKPKAKRIQQTVLNNILKDLEK